MRRRRAGISAAAKPGKGEQGQRPVEHARVGWFDLEQERLGAAEKYHATPQRRGRRRLGALVTRLAA